MKEGSDTVIALLQMQRNQIAICWMVNRAMAAFLDGARGDQSRCKVMTLRGRIAGSSGPRQGGGAVSVGSASVHAMLMIN
jgi:hypothetical protein